MVQCSLPKQCVLIPINQIVSLPQVRQRLDPKRVERMVASITAGGLMQPIRIRREPDGTLVVVDGHYRLAAVTALGWTEVPAIVDESLPDTREVIGVQLATAQCRFDLNPMEEARGYDRYLRESGATASTLAALVGRSEAQVSRARALVGIREELQELVGEGKLGPSVALELDKVRDVTLYTDLVDRARSGDLTREDLHRLRKPPRAAKTNSKSVAARPTRIVIPLQHGCSVTIGHATQAVSDIVEQLTQCASRIREAGNLANGDFERFMALIRGGPGVSGPPATAFE